MPTFQEIDSSVDNAKPIELFHFDCQQKQYYYTSASEKIRFQAVDYVPVAIERSEIQVNCHDADTAKLTITMPATVRIAKDYGYNITPPRILLTAYRVFQGYDFESIFGVIWKGYVTATNTENNTFTMTVPSLFNNVLKMQYPSFFYQQPCNHALYDALCGVSDALHSHETTVQEINGRFVKLAGIGDWADGAFMGGEIIDMATLERRVILNNTATDLELKYEFAYLKEGGSVRLRQGCDHSTVMCKARFNNAINYGGFNYIPSINPFLTQDLK